MKEQERMTGITFDVYEVPPPHEWFWVVKIAAQGDVTKHHAIRNLPLYHVLTYADGIARQNTPPQET